MDRTPLFHHLTTTIIKELPIEASEVSCKVFVKMRSKANSYEFGLSSKYS